MQQELKAEDCNGGMECTNNTLPPRQSFNPKSTLYPRDYHAHLRKWAGAMFCYTVSTWYNTQFIALLAG